jgi:RNA polymerase sigma factor (sigma-70 family)
MIPARASSHREAPLISQDPLADNTDVYAFVSPERSDRVVLIANFIPLQFPSSGPNFWKFDDHVLYEIMVDNTGDAVEDVTYQFRFNTSIRNPNTFLYNTGVVTSLDDPDLNVRQFMTVTKVTGPRRTGSSRAIGANVPVMPANVGVTSMPDYNGFGMGTGVFTLENGTRVFAGSRDEGFYVDLGATFDLLQERSLVPNRGRPIDSLAGYNVHSIAIEVPIAELTRTGSRPSSAADPNATIGPERAAVLSEERRTVQRALRGLPADQRGLIEAAFFDGYTHSELADRFSLPLGTVKTRIRTGMLALRSQLIHLSVSQC